MQLSFALRVNIGKARRVAVAGTLCSSLWVEKADINEAGLAAIRKQSVALMNERNSLVYHLEAVQQVVSSLQRKAELSMGQMYLWNDATHQRQLTLDH